MPKVQATLPAGAGVPGREKFDEVAPVVLANLRGALGRLIEALPGPVRGPADIQRVLRLDWSLSWQLYRVGTVIDPVEAGPDVPRASPLAKALRAAESKGVPGETIGRVQEAFDDFERLVSEHAGDRGSFDSMVRALRQGTAHIHLKERRAAFRSLSGIWGVQADVRYHCAIAHEGAKPGLENVIVLSGYVGLRKLRPGAPVGIGSRSRFGPMGNTTPVENIAVQVLQEFSTQPSPPIALKTLDANVVETMLQIEDVGRRGSTSHFLRWMIHDSPQEAAPALWGSSVISRLPTACAVLDLCIPAGWSDPGSAQVATYGNLAQRERGWSRDEADRLPVEESITYLGRDVERMQTALVPRCPEMVSFVMREAGWENREYDIYRCVVEYPILLACMATRVDAIG